ncbi:unnamed protein product [Rhizophagus irregularis]|nr:unnamed protein product [Rhizophagus irregularis]
MSILSLSYKSKLRRVRHFLDLDFGLGYLGDALPGPGFQLGLLKPWIFGLITLLVSITAKVERIFSEINGKLTVKLNTKISNINSPHVYPWLGLLKYVGEGGRLLDLDFDMGYKGRHFLGSGFWHGL